MTTQQIQQLVELVEETAEDQGWHETEIVQRIEAMFESLGHLKKASHYIRLLLDGLNNQTGVCK